MDRLKIVAGVAILAFGSLASGQTPDLAAKKLPPALVLLLKLSPDEFIKRFDKNRDGTLTRDEVPPFLAQRFDKIDTNGDGKLDRAEIERFQEVLRKRFGQQAQVEPNLEIERVVNKFLQLFDTDKDGKISKAEARGRLAEKFALFDTNKDGYLDRVELRRVAARFLLAKQGTPATQATASPPALDFDALDRNADGRLTRDELKGTPLASRFDEIDTNHDGQIDRREFAEFQKREAQKKP
jgi:Ca2+-binding EF-hand superfamily protein